MTRSVQGRCLVKCQSGDSAQIEFRTLGGGDENEDDVMVITARPGSTGQMIHVELSPEAAQTLHRALGDILSEIV